MEMDDSFQQQPGPGVSAEQDQDEQMELVVDPVAPDIENKEKSAGQKIDGWVEPFKTLEARVNSLSKRNGSIRHLKEQLSRSKTQVEKLTMEKTDLQRKLEIMEENEEKYKPGVASVSEEINNAEIVYQLEAAKKDLEKKDLELHKAFKERDSLETENIRLREQLEAAQKHLENKDLELADVTKEPDSSSLEDSDKEEDPNTDDDLKDDDAVIKKATQAAPVAKPFVNILSKKMAKQEDKETGTGTSGKVVIPPSKRGRKRKLNESEQPPADVDSVNDAVVNQKQPRGRPKRKDESMSRQQVVLQEKEKATKSDSQKPAAGDSKSVVRQCQVRLRRIDQHHNLSNDRTPDANKPSASDSSLQMSSGRGRGSTDFYKPYFRKRGQTFVCVTCSVSFDAVGKEGHDHVKQQKQQVPVVAKESNTSRKASDATVSRVESSEVLAKIEFTDAIDLRKKFKEISENY